MEWKTNLCESTNTRMAEQESGAEQAGVTRFLRIRDGRFSPACRSLLALGHMSCVELLTVEDSFQISGRGVIVIPDFSVPDGWKDRTESITVARPDGQQFEATAHFSMSHFNIPDPQVSIDRRWRVVVLLPDRAKDELPAGSRILVSPEVRDAILPHNVA